LRKKPSGLKKSISHMQTYLTAFSIMYSKFNISFRPSDRQLYSLAMLKAILFLLFVSTPSFAQIKLKGNPTSSPTKIRPRPSIKPSRRPSFKPSKVKLTQQPSTLKTNAPVVNASPSIKPSPPPSKPKSISTASPQIQGGISTQSSAPTRRTTRIPVSNCTFLNEELTAFYFLLKTHSFSSALRPCQ